jgi:hypothetical protein
MHGPSALWLLSLALGLAIAAGCGENPPPPPPPAPTAPGAPTGVTPAAPPATPAQSDETGASVPLIEASGVAIRGDGKVAVIGGDQDPDHLFAVALDDFTKRWRLPYPPGTPPLRDIEGVAPWGKTSVIVCPSSSRTKKKDKVKPERCRLALVALSDDARRVLRVQVYEDIRDPLVEHLVKELRDRLADPVAVADERPQDGGFNIEGIAVWKGRLLVGLRAPTAKGGGAIVIPIDHPERLFEPGGASRPLELGKPYVLSTKPGEGVRDLCADGDTVLVILGPTGDGGEPRPRLARWNPETGDLQPLHAKGFDKIDRPEGLALDPDGRLIVVQDQKAPLTRPILFRLMLDRQEKRDIPLFQD